MSVKDWLWLYERLPTFKCIDFETIWDQNTCLKTNDKKNSYSAFLLTAFSLRKQEKSDVFVAKCTENCY